MAHQNTHTTKITKMEHKRLRKELVNIVKHVPAVADFKHFEKPITRLVPHPASSSTSTTTTMEDLTLEYEYTKTYKDLVDIIDALMNVENAHKDDRYEKKLAALKLVHDYTGDGDISGDENKLRYLKEMQEVRKLVIESGMSTLPLLRAVHQVEGLSTKERSIADKVYERDELSLKIMALQRDISKKSSELSKVSNEVQRLLEKSQSLTRSLISQHQPEELSTEDQSRLKELEEEYEKYDARSQRYAEEIEAIVVEQGLNWAQDDQLLEIIELCGSVYSSELD